MATANNMKIIFDLRYRTARFAPPSMPANYASTWADHSAFCDGHSAPSDAVRYGVRRRRSDAA